MIIGVFVMMFLFAFLAQKYNKSDDVDAASLAGFDPGYIISDYQMSNYNSMSEADIQRFLTSKNPCSNTDYNYYRNLSSNSKYKWHWKDGHFVCLSEERFGDGETIGSGETAARIIWKAAQDYKINPQVLIVLLQKETGLITDPIPNNGDYRKATGYGCPDTAPCSSEYYGFKNQVRKAASMFRTVLNGGWTNYPLGNNYIQYNPNASCGGSVVNIRSLATSALYRYTPYQPNAGALAAGYGTAYCGAYGNRNFYLYFEDWFGGITNKNVEWQDMKSPRVMTIKQQTLIIDALNQTSTDIWLEAGENYFFTKKTMVFWGGEQQVCLKRKIDEGKDSCVLIARLSDSMIEKDAVVLPEPKRYEVKQWTCAVEVLSQKADCNKKEFHVGEQVTIGKQIKVDGKLLLIIEGSYAILRERVRPVINYEKIGPILMRLKYNTFKYIADEKEKVQLLNIQDNQYISIMDKVVIDNELYYRTSYDNRNSSDYVIPASAFEGELLNEFLYPRNLVFTKDVNSVSLDNGQICKGYNEKTIRRFIRKIDYNGIVYYQTEEERGTHCVIDSAYLMESEYNLIGLVGSIRFVGFLYPRRLRLNEDTYMIDVRNGVTCNKLLRKGDVRRYNTKIDIKEITFFRPEEETASGSYCAVPARLLLDTN